jgi:hypothetical protein
VSNHHGIRIQFFYNPQKCLIELGRLIAEK